MAFSVNTERPQMQDNRPKFEWGTIDDGSYQFVYVGSRNKQEKSYDDRFKKDGDPTIKMVDRIEFAFILLRPGAHEAMLQIEAMEDTPERKKALEAWNKKYKGKHHGKMYWLTVNQPKYLGLPGEVKKVSNLYYVLRGLLNNGRDLNKGHIAQVVELVNALEGKDAAGNPLPELADGSFVRPQFMCSVEQDVEKGKNYLVKVIRRVEEDEMLPDYRPFTHLADAREANDDPTIVCAECGEHIHGYEIGFGEEEGKWIDNREAAKRSRERYGKALCSKDIGAIKRQQKAQEGAKGATAAAATAKKGAASDEEDMPF